MSSNLYRTYEDKTPLGLGVHLAWFGEVVLGEQEGPWTWVRQEQGSSLLSCYFQAM